MNELSGISGDSLSSSTSPLIRERAYLSLMVLGFLLGFGLIGYYFYLINQMPSSPGSYMQDTSQLNEYLSSLPTSTLSQEEIDGLLYMREEEKLARDVYLTFYDEYGTLIFQNIANSEQTHMDAVLLLLTKYNLTDPVANASRGEFTNPHLQELYTRLVANGSTSLADALKVGALIEEVDIVDLNDYLEHTDNEDIQTVYEFLRAGSYNHLRGFTSQLETLGVSYSPQLLSQSEYEEIISSPIQRGGMYFNTPSQASSVNASTVLLSGIGFIALGIIFLVLFNQERTKRLLAQH